jgi:hypothetical protein
VIQPSAMAEGATGVRGGNNPSAKASATLDERSRGFQNACGALGVCKQYDPALVA